MTDDDSLALPAEAKWREEGWRIQTLRDRLRRLLGITDTRINYKAVAATLILLLGVFMIGWPLLTFYMYLRSGILLLSPALALMFLAGFVALGLARAKNWQ